MKRRLLSICAALAFASGIPAATSPAMASTSGPTTSAAPLTSATLMPPAMQTVKAAFTGTALCDLSGLTSMCVNLRYGSCATGTVVQGYQFENTDDYEVTTTVTVNGGRVELTFAHCAGRCIAHASNHNLYLSACSSSGPDTWVIIRGPGGSNMFTPGGGTYMWASTVGAHRWD